MAGLYDNFDASKQIRLFTNISFLDDHDQGLICGSLQVVNAIETQRQYIALSYAWGRPEEKSAVLIDGHIVMVPTSLVSFIEMLKIKYQINELKFWADAICIDQSNRVEKAIQVRNMKSIFENASQVLAWLGPQDCDGQVAMVMVKKILAHHSAQDKMSDSTDLVLSVVAGALEFMNLKHGEPFDVEPYDALYRFVTIPWWSRAWIKQEASTETITALFCGEDYLTRTEMFIVAHYARTIFEEINHQWKCNSSVKRYEHRMMRRMLNRMFALCTLHGYRKFAELDALPTSALAILEYVRNSEC